MPRLFKVPELEKEEGPLSGLELIVETAAVVERAGVGEGAWVTYCGEIDCAAIIERALVARTPASSVIVPKLTKECASVGLSKTT